MPLIYVGKNNSLSKVLPLKSIQIACLLTIFVFLVLVVPVTHGAHDTLGHHCTLCQLGHSSFGDVVEVQTVIDGFELRQWLRQASVRTFDSQAYLPSGSRAPPA